VISTSVYNHTAEGIIWGHLHFKGIDNPTYYRLCRAAPLLFRLHGTEYHQDDPQVLALIMDSSVIGHRRCTSTGSLRSRLRPGRQLHDVDQLSSFSP